MKLIEQRNSILAISKKLIAAGLIHDGQGNISCFDRQSGLVAITPSAVPYSERSPEDLPLVDLDGKLVEGNWQPTSEIDLHLVFYRNREDVHAVIHTHAPKASVFSVIEGESLPMVLTEAAMMLGGEIPIAPYGRPGSRELAEITFQATGMGSAAIMAHHGLISVGENIELAYLATIAAENTAEVLISARSMGYEIAALSITEIKALREIASKHKPKSA